MNRTLLLSVFLLFAALRADSQDTITRTDRKVIVADILGIGGNTVRYKLYNSSDTTIITESKGNIASLRLANGVKEVFDAPPPLNCPPCKPDDKIDAYHNIYFYHHNKTNEREAERIMRNTQDPAVLKELKRAETARPFEYVAIGAAPLAFLGVFSMLSWAYSGNRSTGTIAVVCFSGAVICPVIATVARQIKTSHIHKALHIYNEHF